MKLKKLNKALMAAGLIAGSAMMMPAQAVMNSTNGKGEVLIYPFYTVQGPSTAARTTLMTIVNHSTTEYKAVKVRFHEAHNSRDALDFNLYLSPFDVWTGVVSRNAAGVAQLTTSDKSCTIPTSIMTGPTVFSTAAYTQASNNDGGNQDALRTNEGYVEVIEMGVVDPLATLLTTGASVNGQTTFGGAIKHVNGLPGGSTSGGVPTGCQALQASAISANGRWLVPSAGGNLDNSHAAVSEPTGNLSGTGLIVQSALGTVTGYNAKALTNFYDVAPYTLGACGPALPYVTGNRFCETNATADAATTTNRAFDDIHSFKDLDPTTANARSVQTYPNLAMAYPQISSHVTTGNTGGTLTLREWADNERVSSGITATNTPVYFAAGSDLKVALANSAAAALTATCGGTNGVASTAAAGPSVCGNARPVSAVLAATNLQNEFVLEQDAASGIDFRSDIVVTFPTKWYFTDNGLFNATNTTVVDSTGVTVPALATYKLPPFTSQFVNSAATSRDRACEEFDITVRDREEFVQSTPGVLVPSPAISADPTKNFFCQEANVVSLNGGDLLSSRIANGLSATVANAADGKNAFNLNITPTTLKSGWFDIAFKPGLGHAMTPVAVPGPARQGGTPIAGTYDAAAVNGLPAVGMVVEGLVNGAPGFIGNFTTAIEHKTN